MTLHVAPGDGFFGTQRTVVWIFHSMNLHLALKVWSVVAWHLLVPQFLSIFSVSACSVSSTDSVVVSLIFTASLELSPIYTAAAHLSLLLSILSSSPLLGPW